LFILHGGTGDVNEFDLGPDAVQHAPARAVQVAHHLQAGQRRRIRENRADYRRFPGGYRRGGRAIRVAGTDEVGEFRRVFAFQHEVDEAHAPDPAAAGLVQHHGIQRQHRAFASGSHSRCRTARPGFICVLACLEHVVGIAVRQPDVADGQFLDVARRVERCPVGLGAQDQIACLLPPGLVGVVDGMAQVFHRRGYELALRIEDSHSALDLLQVARLEDQRPGVGGQVRAS
jgi:hypothetical protein